MLDFDPNRPPAPPRPAATTLVLRDGPRGVEVLCILRHPKSSFLGGMLAFPGGRVDEADREQGWAALSEPLGAPPEALSTAPAPLGALAVAACRELLEEVAVVPIEGVSHEQALQMRERMKAGASFAEVVRSNGRPLGVASLVPFGRWVTPEAESRRYDATFFVARLPAGQKGESDEHETTAVLWDTPSALLARWEAGEVQMAPPTTRMLELLGGCARVDDAFGLAGQQSLLPVCPRFVPDEQGGYLALPGDPGHEVGERRVAGGTRFVLKNGRFVSEDAPPKAPA